MEQKCLGNQCNISRPESLNDTVVVLMTVRHKTLQLFEFPAKPGPNLVRYINSTVRFCVRLLCRRSIIHVDKAVPDRIELRELPRSIFAHGEQGGSPPSHSLFRLEHLACCTHRGIKSESPSRLYSTRNWKVTAPNGHSTASSAGQSGICAVRMLGQHLPQSHGRGRIQASHRVWHRPTTPSHSRH